MKTEQDLMNDTAHEIILDSLAGALSAHNPNWAVIPTGIDPVIDVLKKAVCQVESAYPDPSDPVAAAAFADFFRS